uniref:Uncharacterized protein n=1 Tax=Anguilla anguilla TaxID=7936 RepID=A0A0E9PWI0_ANGAN
MIRGGGTWQELFITIIMSKHSQIQVRPFGMFRGQRSEFC